MSQHQPVSPVPAATVLVCRDGEQGLEVFMVVRHHQIDFASGALVFPGGKLEAQDSDPEVLARCAKQGGHPEADVPMQVACIRETFEECGLLLARPRGERALISADRLAHLEDDRSALVEGRLTLAQFLEREDLELALDCLHFFAHWVTPKMVPKRFDTHFYLAKAPADQLAVHDGSESVDSVWISPQRALEGAESGQYTVIFPTKMNLLKLAEAQNVGSAIERSRTAEVVTVEPWIEQRDGGSYLTIPANAGYPHTAEKVK
ncbi:MAG: NUDIX hydrolase [Pseudomonadota bacterium]|nr:NUDIX hydrolase [Pseudomonadota bacterium]